MDKVNFTLFRGKRVLVTGSTGFKGSWLCAWLKELGAEVYGMALQAPGERSNFTACDMPTAMVQAYVDIRDRDFVSSMVDNIQPEIVFHLAAQPIVLTSYRIPVETFDTNVMGTINVLEACRLCHNLRSIVVVSSDKCYSTDVRRADENSPLGGKDPYSASKAACDLAARAYYESFFSSKGIGLSTVRAGNVIGGGDWANNRIIPDCVRAIETGSDIVIRNPSHIRPWQYVLEPLCGYLLLGSKMYASPEKYSSAWNFGPQEAYPPNVKEVATMVLDYAKGLGYGAGVKIQLNADSQEGRESSFLSIDSSKSIRELGFRNVLTTEEAVRWTVEDYFGKRVTLEVLKERIQEYENVVFGGTKI